MYTAMISASSITMLKTVTTGSTRLWPRWSTSFEMYGPSNALARVNVPATAPANQ